MGIEDRQRTLIVNADDLGLAPGVTRGIVELARLGVVTSTSLLTTTPDAAEALDTARAAGLDVGLHLNIGGGVPLSPATAVPSLLGPDGRFLAAGAAARRLVMGRLRLGEVEREWSAQIERFLALGAVPSHLDSHCHLHGYPRLDALACCLARRYGIPGVRPALRGYIFQPPRLHRMRYRLRYARPAAGHGAATPYRPDHFTVLTVLAPLRSLRPLEALLHALPPGVTELVCHPGHVDDALRRLDPLTDQREREWLLLSRPAFQDILAREGIRLVSWAQANRR